MKLLSITIILLYMCLGLVLSERNRPHEDRNNYGAHPHRPQESERRREYAGGHRGGHRRAGFNRDDKYDYFYREFGEKGEGVSHGRLFEHHARREGKKPYCVPTDPCWPTADDLAHIYNALNPDLHRSLVYNGPGTPLPAAVPEGSPGDQPLYGEGLSLAPAAINDAPGETCNFETSQFCRLTVRNNPLEGWAPAFVAWPTTAAQVQLLVAFATTHNLCIAVTNSGHDFLNRHSCAHSLNIRTSLLKDTVWDESPFTVTVGAGVTSSELQAEASVVKKAVATAWTKSVGVVGWAIGGGHGPLSPRLGLGADQIVGVQLVGPDGCLYSVDASGTEKKHLDGRVERYEDCELLWAVRGGGGSTWGVITALTLKTHPLPKDGYTGLQLAIVGDFCTGKEAFLGILTQYLEWSLTLDAKWGGYAFLTPFYDPTHPDCPAQWAISLIYLYQGGAGFLDTWNALLDVVPAGVEHTSAFGAFPHVWSSIKDWQVERVVPWAYLPATEDFPGAVPSVLLSREVVRSGAVAELIAAQLEKCSEVHCDGWEFTQDLTGNLGSPQDADVAVSAGMRTGLFHLMTMTTKKDLPLYYALGENSYFSESAYEMEGWPERLWGRKNFKRLGEIKRKFDGGNVFWCRHCVGDEVIVNKTYSYSP